MPSRRRRGWAARRLLCAVIRTGRPPDNRADQREQRRDDQRADNECVDQDTEADDQSHLPQHDQRQTPRTQNTAANTMPALVITPPVADTARTIPSPVPCSAVSSRARVTKKIV